MVRILFMHPDLGIGGAERLVVDAAIALQNKGHEVSFLTNHHSPEHCFAETRNGTLKVEVVGDWLPRHLFGRCFALCAYIRMIYASLYLSFDLWKGETQIDVIFCDIVSFGIPIFGLLKNPPKILFYCHFPDQLLSQPGSQLKQLYRMPLNYLEEITTGQADVVLVNSKFTRSVYQETFKRLRKQPLVLYPSLNTKYFDETDTTDISDDLIPADSRVFLSINRYEGKKNVALAITAFHQLKQQLESDQWNRLRLVIAGGYDERVEENVYYFNKLKSIAKDLQIIDQIIFLKSPNDQKKVWLLRRCEVLIYTPSNEHFGIVPLEGMYNGKPVIAVDNGGPTETVCNESTGFLCESNPAEFSNAMLKFVSNPELSVQMGANGKEWVERNFSFAAFSNKLDEIIMEMLAPEDNSNKSQ